MKRSIGAPLLDIFYLVVGVRLISHLPYKASIYVESNQLEFIFYINLIIIAILYRFVNYRYKAIIAYQ